MLPKLDPLLHSELRLAIMSILAGADEADFNYLKVIFTFAGLVLVATGLIIKHQYK